MAFFASSSASGKAPASLRWRGFSGKRPRKCGARVCLAVVGNQGQLVFTLGQVEVSLGKSLGHGIGAFLRYSLETEENYDGRGKSYAKTRVTSPGHSLVSEDYTIIELSKE